MKLIDKDALVAEIENLENTYKKCPTRNSYEEGLKDGRLIGYKDALHEINTFEVKEMNLDDFIKEEFNKHSCVDGYQLSVSYNMAEFYSMIKRLTKAQKGE